MAHECDRWRPGPFTPDQCHFCWRAHNANHHLPTGTFLHLSRERSTTSTIATTGERLPSLCVHLGDIIKPCSRGNVHRCEFAGHEWTKCTPGTHIVDPEARSCVNCPHRDDGANGLADVLAMIDGPEIVRDRAETKRWCKSKRVQAAYRLAMRRFVAGLEKKRPGTTNPRPETRFTTLAGDADGSLAGRETGINRGVIFCGGDKYAKGIYVSIRMFREVGCNLPVQVWHRGDAEPVPAAIRELDGVTVIDATAHLSRERWRTFGGWQLKLIAGLWSGFREWIYSDADNYPVANPERCFDNDTGAMLWPDVAYNDAAVKWSSYGLKPPANNTGTNGGSAVFDLARCWRALHLAHWFDMHSDYWYKLEHGVGGFGDQDQIRAAFHLTGTPFTLCGHRPDNRRGIFVQPGPDGKPLWVHRIHDKQFQRIDRALPMESRAHEFAAEFNSCA